MSKPTRNLNSMEKTVVDEALTRQVATVLLTGASTADCAKQLGITVAAVRKIVSTDKYKELVTETAEGELGPALAKAKSQLARLTTKAIKAVEEMLDTGGGREKLEAAKIVLRAVGLHEEGEKQGDQTLNIILPSGAPVDCESIVISGESNNESQ